MRTPRNFVHLALAVLLAISVMPAIAQQSGAPTYGADRLFLSFMEDATLIDNQWWEGQFLWIEGDPPETIDTMILRAVAAVNPHKNLEVGGRVGFGSTDAPSGADGSGATDLDLYGKWYFGANQSDTEFAAGAILTIPTGDDTAGLGYDAFAAAAFGSLRHRFDQFILTGNLGVRFTADGNYRGADIDGKLAPFLAAGVLFPISDQVTLVGEASFESKRFEGADSAATLLGGVNWHLSNRGIVRGALSIGLSDGAPDATLLGGYVWLF